MGMAASQARYLGLTARKTNVEYEGQQINQSRTALSNQSATLWNQQLALQVPTVPDVEEFTETQYKFSDGINTYTITDMQSVDHTTEDGTEYNKLVTYETQTTVYKGIETTNSNPQVQKVDTTTYIQDTDVQQSFKGLEYDKDTDTFTYDGGNPLNLTEVTDKDTINQYLKANNMKAFPTSTTKLYAYDTGNGIAYKELDTGADIPATDTTFTGIKETTVDGYKLGNSTATQCKKGDVNLSEVDKTAIEQIIYDMNQDGGNGAITEEMFENGEIYKYVKNGQTFYCTKDALDECYAKSKHEESEYAISSNMDFQPSLVQYYATTLEQTVSTTDYALMDDASGTGRYQSIKLDGVSTTFDLESGTVTNEDGYNNAMNQYNYDLVKYEKAMADINAKTSKIQVEDRTLELRLKQLETEQKALSTEMEAVKGVIQKNVESTFGTFK